MCLFGATLAVLLASCTSDPSADLDLPSYNSAELASQPADVAAAAESNQQSASEAPAGAARPDQVVNVPAAGSPTAQKTTTEQDMPARTAGTDEQNGDALKQAKGDPQADADTTGKPAQVIATAGDPAEAMPAKKKNFLSSFFGTSPAAAAPSPIRQDRSSSAASAKPAQTFIENRPVASDAEASPKPDAKKAAKPIIDLQPARKPAALASLGSDNGLPGVRQTSLFEIKRKSGLDDDSDIDVHEEDEYGPIQVAYSAGLARLAPNGLLKQTETVETACLKPNLVRMLKAIEQRFGRKLIITSGYRSRAHNVRVNGARNSMHMYCAAADIHVPGVSKWDIAQFVRSLPGRGGVGTYCHTNAVHVDVGPERDWNWRCGRRKA
ncbi:YcbK family protein [Pseudaminobacter soli (ex Zhang et al. 2022)]|uniref:YcbK family protein n=1 Tax=Pseudaminobacter soli (ex Zhang et al. 2022) TaxID=2831468 RepID=UPI001F31E379|nr:YcbK family protein [Pseudaminobacter soli]